MKLSLGNCGNWVGQRAANLQIDRRFTDGDAGRTRQYAQELGGAGT
jgi:hypothetical protein